jgi:methylmalonyl-CoA mutase
LFLEIDRAGGAAAALEQGLIQKNVAAARDARMQALKDGKEALTGTTIFPNPDEMPVAVLDVAPVHPESRQRAAIEFQALVAMRLAEPFE